MKIIKVCLLFGMPLLLFGCASGARFHQMMASGHVTSGFDKVLISKIEVSRSTGGKETNPVLMPQISNNQFTSAIKHSLENYGLLANKNDARYSLRSSIIALDQPVFGVDFTVTTVVKYELLDIKTRKIIFEETIDSAYSTTMSDAYVATTRLQLANEGSARENIHEFLRQLSKLEIPSHQITVSER